MAMTEAEEMLRLLHHKYGLVEVRRRNRVTYIATGIDWHLKCAAGFGLTAAQAIRNLCLYPRYD